MAEFKECCFSDNVFNDLKIAFDNINAFCTEIENNAAQIKEVRTNVTAVGTALGYQKKNLFNPNAVNWYQPTKTSIAEDGTITSTATSDSRLWSLANAEYFLTLPAGKYIVKTITESLGENSIIENIRGYNESGSQVFEIYPNIVGTRTTTFTIDETATIGFMFKLITQTCKIMVYNADITDGTYEPYVESVDERLNALLARIEALEAAK